MKNRTYLYPSAGLLALICFGCSAGPTIQPLQRGVNLSHWFSQTSLPDHPPLPATLEDVELMRSLGLDHVRLPIDPARLWDFPGGGPLKSGMLKEIDAAIRLALESNLAVVVDIHPKSGFTESLQNDPVFFESSLKFWSVLAGHLAQYDPKRLGLEILNEPQVNDPEQWQTMVEQLHRVIRKAAPNHTIIVSGCRWSSADDLRRLTPLADPNIIYTFHFYEPHAFTHQGARWGSPGWLRLKDIPYPLSREKGTALLEGITHGATRHALQEYMEQDWDCEKIKSRIAGAAEWAEQHSTVIWCGEFGVYQPYAPPDARACYLSDVRTALEKHGIGWALWNYQGSFGFVTKGNPSGPAKVDRSVAEALGLELPKP